MRRLMIWLVVAGTMALAASLAVAADPAPSAVTLPDSAGTELAKAFPNATVKTVSAYEYLVDMTDAGNSFTVRMHKGGLIIMVTTPMVPVTDLPKPVVDAATAAAKGAKFTINKASKLERRADENLKILPKPEVTYDMHVVLAEGGSLSMTVAEDGTVTQGFRMR